MLGPKEFGVLNLRALHLSRRAPWARVDLSSDKERLGIKRRVQTYFQFSLRGINSNAMPPMRAAIWLYIQQKSAVIEKDHAHKGWTDKHRAKRWLRRMWRKREHQQDFNCSNDCKKDRVKQSYDYCSL
jgi:hypothetical protein